MGWVDDRISACESRIEYLMRLIQDLRDQILRADQNARNAFAQASPGQISPTGGAYVCTPGSVIAAGGSASVTVSVMQSGVQTSVGSQIVYNPYGAATVASKVCTLVPDGQGNFVVYAQSC